MNVDQSLLELIAVREGLERETCDSQQAFEAWGQWASTHDWYPVMTQEVLKALVEFVVDHPESDRAIQDLPYVLLQPTLFALNR